MILTNSFPGDTNDTLKQIQHIPAGGFSSRLVQECRARYQAAVALVGEETELWRRLAGMDGFDDRVLQAAYDSIAAYYRFAFNKSQMPLPLDRWPYEERLLRDWMEFFGEEARRLAEDDQIARAVLTAVAYQNTPAGYEAQQELLRLLDERYGGYSCRDGEE
jgi:hypothetical protein